MVQAVMGAFVETMQRITLPAANVVRSRSRLIDLLLNVACVQPECTGECPSSRAQTTLIACWWRLFGASKKGDYFWKRDAARVTISSAMASEAVAAGDGALQTCNERAFSTIRKSSTRSPLGR